MIICLGFHRPRHEASVARFYDGDGNTTETIDRDNRATAYTYDKLNRMTAEKWHSGTSITDSPTEVLTYTYDPDNHVLSTEDSGAAVNGSGTDAHWTVKHDGDSGNGSAAKETVGSSSWVHDGIGSGYWYITYSGGTGSESGASNGNPITYLYSTTVTVPSTVSGTVSLSGIVSADNSLGGISVNGGSYMSVSGASATSDSNTTPFTSWHSFTISGLHAGDNTVTFKVTDFGTVTGLAVRWSGAGSADGTVSGGVPGNVAGLQVPRFAYTGGEYNPISGEYLFARRFYNPLSGRFESTDPAGADVNPYRYASDDPTVQEDPTGLSAAITQFSAQPSNLNLWDGLPLGYTSGNVQTDVGPKLSLGSMDDFGFASSFTNSPMPSSSLLSPGLSLSGLNNADVGAGLFNNSRTGAFNDLGALYDQAPRVTPAASTIDISGIVNATEDMASSVEDFTLQTIGGFEDIQVPWAKAPGPGSYSGLAGRIAGRTIGGIVSLGEIVGGGLLTLSSFAEDATVVLAPAGAAQGMAGIAVAAYGANGLGSMFKPMNYVEKSETGPTANNGIANQHGGDLHDQHIEDKITELKANRNVSDIRKNQAQVDIYGNKVGDNRPDLQWNENGVHYNYEVDNDAERSAAHWMEIRQNDPDSVIIQKVLGK